MPRPRHASVLALLTILLLGPAPVSAAADPVRELKRLARSREAPGIVLVVARRGRVEQLELAGLADREGELPLEATMRWPLGELSRLPTALLAAGLAAEGRLDLDRPLADWIGPEELDFDPARLSLRDLLAQRSGLPPQRLAGAYRRPGEPASALRPEDFYLAQPPRLLIQPSALGYALVGRVLERASGKGFLELLGERLAEPLGLRALGAVEEGGLVRAHRRGRPEAPLLARDLAATGLAASAEDLARLLAALTAPEPTLPGRDLLFEPHRAELGFGATAGLGLALSESAVPGTGRLARIQGAYPGFRAELTLALDHGVAVLVLVNAAEGFRVVDRLAGLALDRALGRDPAAREAARRAREELPERIPWPEEARPQAPAPRYATPFGLLRVEGGGERFAAEVFGLRFTASRRADGWYEVRYRLLGLVPLPLDVLRRVVLAPAAVGERHLLLAWFSGRVVVLGSALEAPTGAGDGVALLGRWRVSAEDPLLAQLELREAVIERQDGLLTIGYEIPFLVTRLRPRLVLAADGAGLRTHGTAAGLGERLRRGRDEAGEYLEYSGFRLRRVP